MSDGIATLEKWAEGRARRLERAVVMHGTTRFREESARCLVELVTATGASGAAYGWTDALGPDELQPVHAVSAVSDTTWRTDEGASFIESRASVRPGAWQLVIRGVDSRDVEASRELVDRALGWFSDAHDRDVPRIHPSVRDGAAYGFLSLLDGFRAVGFEIRHGTEIDFFRGAFQREMRSLPPTVQPAAARVVEGLTAPDTLTAAILALGHAFDAAGCLPEAASAHVIGYESALARVDAGAGADFARAAGRAFRGLADWDTALRWYRLAQRIATFEADDARLAIALDGEGNTHREQGAYPTAAACYRRAWEHARRSDDASVIGTIGHSMMVAERAAGRLAAAARYGGIALSSQTNPEARARLLVELGTLLVELGDAETARRAYRLGAHVTGDTTLRALAWDAVAHTDAILGKWDAYEAHRRRARRGAHGMSPQLRAQMGYYRGRCLLLRGRSEAAARVLATTERMATACGASRWAVEAGELRDGIRRRQPLPHSAVAEAPAEVRQGLANVEAELLPV